MAIAKSLNPLSTVTLSSGRGKEDLMRCGNEKVLSVSIGVAQSPTRSGRTKRIIHRTAYSQYRIDTVYGVFHTRTFASPTEWSGGRIRAGMNQSEDATMP